MNRWAATWGSFCQESFEEAGRTIFVGTRDYADLVGDPLFWKSLWVTFKLNAVINPVQVALALLLARALAIVMVLILLVSITVVIQFYFLRQQELS